MDLRAPCAQTTNLRARAKQWEMRELDRFLTVTNKYSITVSKRKFFTSLSISLNAARAFLTQSGEMGAHERLCASIKHRLIAWRRVCRIRCAIIWCYPAFEPLFVCFGTYATDKETSFWERRPVYVCACECAPPSVWLCVYGENRRIFRGKRSLSLIDRNGFSRASSVEHIDPQLAIPQEHVSRNKRKRGKRKRKDKVHIKDRDFSIVSLVFYDFVLFSFASCTPTEIPDARAEEHEIQLNSIP